MEKLDCHPSNGSVLNKVMPAVSLSPGNWGNTPKITQIPAAKRHPFKSGICLEG